jgi:dipeptidyl aminopeptidase/acylaminoacyl peptidase
VPVCEGDDVQAIQQHHRIPAADGGVLDAHTVQPADGSARWAILVHGGPGGSQDGPAGLFAEVARALADSGVASLRYDARGSGASSGQFLDTTLTSLTRDLRTARAWLAAQHHPDQLALIGESLGGTIAVAGLEGTEQALVLLYAATRLRDCVPDWVTEEALAEAEQRGFIVREDSQIGSAFLREITEQPDVLPALAGLRTPVLLIHGDRDVEVELAQSEQAAGLVAGPVKLVVIPGGGHGLERPGDQEVVVAETTRWLADHLR